MPPARGLKLRFQIATSVQNFKWYQGVRGLCLNLDELRSLGASEDFLHACEHGWELAAVEACAETIVVKQRPERGISNTLRHKCG